MQQPGQPKAGKDYSRHTLGKLCMGWIWRKGAKRIKCGSCQRKAWLPGVPQRHGQETMTIAAPVLLIIPWNAPSPPPQDHQRYGPAQTFPSSSHQKFCLLSLPRSLPCPHEFWRAREMEFCGGVWVQLPSLRPDHPLHSSLWAQHNKRMLLIRSLYHSHTYTLHTQDNCASFYDGMCMHITNASHYCVLHSLQLMFWRQKKALLLSFHV